MVPQTIQRLLLPVSLCLLTIACNQAPPPAPAAAADSGPKASDVFDKNLSSVEREFVSLIEAMPADKFDFAPTKGKFDGVRNFGAQAKHVAAVLNIVSASLLGEPSPGAENGPADMKSKDQIVQYVKDAFAHAHKAVATATGATLLQELPNPFGGKSKMTRVELLMEMSAHTFDHYGQIVEYARMNNVVPPASQ